MSDETPLDNGTGATAGENGSANGAAGANGAPDTTPEGIPRRAKSRNAPPPPKGYRQTRRGSKSAKSTKRAERAEKVSVGFSRTGKLLRDIGYYLALALGSLLVGIIIAALLAYGINAFARWNAIRIAEKNGSRSELEKRSKENVLIIGEKDGQATGFMAIRVDRKGNQVFGIAIPDGAFIEVPGQGFERVGESFAAGPEISLAAIANYLTVPFKTFMVVPAQTYADAMKAQSLNGITKAVTKSNMSEDDLAALSRDLAAIPQKNTAIVPLPVKPIKLGSQTYFEPQREEVADLLKQWWGVDASQTANVTRVILYNGAGTPGIAGEAAQQLIRSGFRVVDTKNADSFDYATTKIVVQSGDKSQGDEIAKVLGVGTVEMKPSDQDVAEVIVIVGKDYKPPAPAGQKGTK